jgi:hypothetical protein
MHEAPLFASLARGDPTEALLGWLIRFLEGSQAQQQRISVKVAPPFAQRQLAVARVRYGSRTTDLRWSRDVRFSPNR